MKPLQTKWISKKVISIFAKLMNMFRQHIVFKIVCLLLAAHIFNISVDMPDANPDDVAEDLTINDQETIVELVLEKCIGIDNAIEEHDEPGDESQNLEILKEFQLYTQPHSFIEFSHQNAELEIKTVYSGSYVSQYANEIIPPPPKA